MQNVVRPTLVAMATTFGLGAESSRLAQIDLSKSTSPYFMKFGTFQMSLLTYFREVKVKDQGHLFRHGQSGSATTTSKRKQVHVGWGGVG